MKSHEPYLGWLYQAAAASLGLVLWSDDPPRLRQALYAARRASLDPELARLQIRLWPNQQVVICHDLQVCEK